MSLESYLPLQLFGIVLERCINFFLNVWYNSLVKPFSPGFCLWEFFDYWLFSLLVLAACVFLGIYQLLLDCPICWYIIFHSILWSFCPWCVILVVISLLSFLVLFIWGLAFLFLIRLKVYQFCLFKEPDLNFTDILHCFSLYFSLTLISPNFGPCVFYFF